MSIINQIHRHAATHPSIAYLAAVVVILWAIIYKFNANSTLTKIAKYAAIAALGLWLFYRIAG